MLRLVGRQLAEKVVSAAYLERPGDLQALGFDENRSTCKLIELMVPDQRRPDGNSIKARGSGFDVVDTYHRRVDSASRSIFAAQMKSLSERPLMACVV